MWNNPNGNATCANEKDIADKDLKTLRNARWDKAFKKGDFQDYVEENPRDEVNRKATIVIEHIIQASDVSHTMVRNLLPCFFLSFCFAG